MSRTVDQRRTAVPRGVASFLPDVAEKKRRVEVQVLGTLARWGYREVVPPLFEYLDVLAQGLVPETMARGYKIEDRQDGRLMVLRPDVTAQVARMAAARRDDPALPHRYGYATNVFSHTEVHRGRPREVFQVGAELLGPGGLAADVEILALLISTLRELGLADFVVSLGQARFFQGILEGLELSPEAQPELIRAVYRKDAPSIRTILSQAGVSDARVALLERLPFLIGGTDVFDTARGMTRCRDALEALDHLERAVKALTACGMGEHVLIDLGEIRDLSYYTGIVFEVLVPDLGFELGGGGRYDDLVARFGHPMHATGFALDVERIIEAMSRAALSAAPPPVDYVVEGDLPEALQAAARLRREGLHVVAGLPGGDIAAPRLRTRGDVLLRVTGNREEPVDVAALLAGAERS